MAPSYNDNQDATYYTFKDLDLSVESEPIKLFNKCHATLRYMKYIVTKVSLSEGKLEACKIFALDTNSGSLGLINGGLGKIDIKLEKVENTGTSYYVKSNFGKQIFAKQSNETNKFINFLISEHKNIHAKNKAQQVLE